MGHNGGAGGAEGLVEAGGQVGQVIAPVQAHLPVPQLAGQLGPQPLLYTLPRTNVVHQPAHSGESRGVRVIFDEENPLYPAQSMLITPGPLYLVPVIVGHNFR